MVPKVMQQFIGKAELPHVREVEKGAIRRYAEAVGNTNPLYFDIEYARKTHHGGIIAPPGFFGRPVRPSSSPTGLPRLVSDLRAVMAEVGYPRILDGGMSYEFFLPVRAGDTLVVSPTVKDVTTKEGKSGKMMVCSLETTYVNQNGDTVAKAHQTFIAR